MRFLNTRGRASVAAMTGRATELVRVVNREKLFVWMTDEGFSPIVRLLAGAVGSEIGSLERKRLADSEMTGLAAINDIRGRDVDLFQAEIKLIILIDERINLRGRQP